MCDTGRDGRGGERRDRAGTRVRRAPLHARPAVRTSRIVSSAGTRVRRAPLHARPAALAVSLPRASSNKGACTSSGGGGRVLNLANRLKGRGSGSVTAVEAPGVFLLFGEELGDDSMGISLTPKGEGDTASAATMQGLTFAESPAFPKLLLKTALLLLLRLLLPVICRVLLPHSTLPALGAAPVSAFSTPVGSARDPETETDTAAAAAGVDVLVLGSCAWTSPPLDKGLEGVGTSVWEALEGVGTGTGGTNCSSKEWLRGEAGDDSFCCWRSGLRATHSGNRRSRSCWTRTYTSM